MRKIHITYNAQEKERITGPILSDKPDVLYYICHNGEIEDIFLNYKDMNLETIRNNMKNCKIIESEVNYIDYYDIISNLAKIISSEIAKCKDEKATFTVNMGTGSKMVAIANIDASRLWDNIILIYPYSLDYDPSAESAHSGIMYSAEPPKFKFYKPSIELIKAMQILYWLMLHDKFERKRNFVLQREWQNAIFHIYKIRTVDQDTSEKMSLNRAIINPLVERWKLIYKEKQGRDHRIYFSDDGLKMVRVFMEYDYGINFDEK
ncbi:MAG: HFX_2341 family transcriptional regulator domain-containing protein [Promethearchaeota archaeon]